MKISFTTLGCPDWNWDKIVAQAVELGYDGIELRGIEGEMYLPKARPFLPENIAKTIEGVKQAGLEIVGLGSSCSFDNPDGFEAAIQEGKDYIDLAQQLGVPYVRVFGDAIPDADRKAETIQQVARGVDALGAYAEDKQVGVLIETHGDFSDAGDLLAVMEQTSSSAVGVLWDIAHPYKYGQGESIEDTYAKLGKYVKHTHVKDTKGRGEEERHCLVGKGDVPLREAIAILQEDGYTGWLSLEWEKKWVPELEEPEVAFPAFMEYIKDVLGK